jgi:hypothetical protein
VSSKDDGTNTTYHLVAAARAVPANPLVEFKYQAGSAAETSIGIATRVGTTDTFHLQWSPGSLADGTVTLKVVMYNGTIELARDEEEVTINNEDSLDDPQAEALEIVSPPVGTLAGFFLPAGATEAHTIIDVTSSDDAGLPSTSAGTDAVVVYYTKTPVGTEPEWVECGDGGGEDEGTTSIRCTLAEGDSYTQVTGLAAVANPLAPVLSGSGDAHRVFPYLQAPTTINLAPQTQTGKAVNTCADVITATVLDQNGKKIAGVNTDVHAKGPSDNVFFDTANNDENQPPDKAHSAPEPGWDCAGDAEAGEQGQHEYPPGNPDTKHIESVAGTTDEAGTFTFQVYSQNPGETNYAVFTDTDDDDQWCAQEKSSRGQVTWVATASPSPSASSSSSPSSSPSSSSSSSPSSAPTSGSTASPIPTTLEPDLAVCPGGSASPSSSPGTSRSVNLSSSRSKVVAGTNVTLSGQIQASSQACEDNEVVEIQRRIHGTSEFKDYKTTASDAQGNFDVNALVTKNADYQAVAPGSGSCTDANSSSVAVLAKVKVTRRAIPASPDRGDNVTIKGRVLPKHVGDKVTLQRKKGTRWVKVATTELKRRSVYRFVVEVDWARRTFRVRWPSQDADHSTGKSRKVVVRAS